jgi:hypothetical protein
LTCCFFSIGIPGFSSPVIASSLTWAMTASR